MFTAQWTAQLADYALNVSVQVDVLAHERRAAAVGTAIAVGLQHVNAATQQEALELLYVLLGGATHGAWVRHNPRHSFRSKPTLGSEPRVYTNVGTGRESLELIGSHGYRVEGRVLDFLYQNS
jgi:hypothetical protein